jgi:hypothetical protein
MLDAPIALHAHVVTDRELIIGDEQFGAFLGSPLPVIIHAVLQFPTMDKRKLKVLANFRRVVICNQPRVPALFHLFSKFSVVKTLVQYTISSIKF